MKTVQNERLIAFKKTESVANRWLLITDLQLLWIWLKLIVGSTKFQKNEIVESSGKYVRDGVHLHQISYSRPETWSPILILSWNISIEIFRYSCLALTAEFKRFWKVCQSFFFWQSLVFLGYSSHITQNSNYQL